VALDDTLGADRWVHVGMGSRDLIGSAIINFSDRFTNYEGFTSSSCSWCDLVLAIAAMAGWTVELSSPSSTDRWAASARRDQIIWHDTF
jgi:hypothetical protein